ncbi:MAG TPA: hypothetical protein VGM91_07765 [Conexibacter sp.]|jgi:hypothetical protein
MASEAQRITIGFHGQSLPVRAPEAQVSELLDALKAGKQVWHELATEDGTVMLDLGKVEYVRLDSHEQRVGFGL